MKEAKKEKIIKDENKLKEINQFSLVLKKRQKQEEEKEEHIEMDLEEVKHIEEDMKNRIIQSSKIKLPKKIKKEAEVYPGDEDKNDINHINQEINRTQEMLDELEKNNLELKQQFNNKNIEITDIYKNLKENGKKINNYQNQIKKEKEIINNTTKNIKDFENKILQSQTEIKKINLENKTDNQKIEQILKSIKNDLENQQENIKNELLIMKENIEKKVKEEYENKIVNEIKYLTKEIKKNIKIKESELQEKLKKKFEKSEIEFEQKFIQTSNITKSKLEGINKISNIQNKINTTHYNIACEFCGKTPIIGYRYKCSQCPNFNLCSECEEKNAHPHYFIKIRKAEDDDKKDDNNLINNNIMDNNFMNIDEENQKNYYDYKCLNNQLTTYILEGENKALIQITLKNTGTQPWINFKTSLKLDKNNSNIKGSDIILKPQLPGSQNNYDINFNDLNRYTKGQYKACYRFTINNKVYGKELVFNIIIQEREN